MATAVNGNQCRVDANRETLAEARKALDEIAVEMIRSRSSGTFGVILVIYEGRLTKVKTKTELEHMNGR